MARPVSAAFRKAVQARETEEAFLLLLTLTHPSLPAPIRVVNDGADLVVGALTFQRFPFMVTLAPEVEDQPPRAQLEICNVDRQIVTALRTVNGDPIAVEISMVMASSPTVIEAGPYQFTLRDTTYDAMVVTGTLTYEDILNRACPPRTMTPAAAPGLF